MAQFNPKFKLGLEGRAKTFQILKDSIQEDDQTFWFHCASLGEYEQGLPVFERLRKKHPSHKIILTFFSPSGYEVRKNTKVANVIVYLPMDTKANAQRFLDLVHPQLTIFVKYDIWPNYLLELKKRQSKAILISALFRKNQSYFKFYGDFIRQALFAFEHIFVQNETSKNLLQTIGYNNVTIAGDTRFDRVSNQLNQDNTLSFIEAFKQDKLCVVIGSSWPEDESILVPFINENSSKDIKYIIAPHNINASQIEHLVEVLKPKTLLFSQMEDKILSEYSVFVIDTVGLLTKIYSYADIAYVGGAIGTTGLHNILEPAVFSVPIIIGKHHDKFPEAKRMIESAGVISVSNSKELKSTLTELILNDKERSELGELNSHYIYKHKGAGDKISDYLRI